MVRSWDQRAGQRERRHEWAFCALTVGVAERDGPLGLMAAAEGCRSRPLSGVHMKASICPSIKRGQAVPAREVASDRQPGSKSFLPEQILKVRDPEERGEAGSLPVAVPQLECGCGQEGRGKPSLNWM